MNEEQLKAKEEQLAARLQRIADMEAQVLKKEKALKEKEKAKKQVLLRLAPHLWDEIASWARRRSSCSMRSARPPWYPICWWCCAAARTLSPSSTADQSIKRRRFS